MSNISVSESKKKELKQPSNTSECGRDDKVTEIYSIQPNFHYTIFDFIRHFSLLWMDDDDDAFNHISCF